MGTEKRSSKPLPTLLAEELIGSYVRVENPGGKGAAGRVVGTRHVVEGGKHVVMLDFDYGMCVEVDPEAVLTVGEPDDDA